MKRASDQWEERVCAEFGEEYAQFLLVKLAPPPRICPICRTPTIHEIWLGDAARMLGDSLRGLWYLWCDSCLRCIRSPVGLCPVPEGGTYIQWSDGQSLLNAMPRGLRMIEPVRPPTPQVERKKPKIWTSGQPSVLPQGKGPHQ